MNIWFYINSNFESEGNPIAKRIKGLATIVKLAGHNPYILFPKPVSDKIWKQDEYKVSYRGIAFDKSYIKKVFPKMYHASELLKYFRKQVKLNVKPDVLVLYNGSAIAYYSLIKFCRANNIKVITDITEYYPLSFKRVLSLNYWDHVIYRKYLTNIINGSIVISSFWRKYLRNKNAVLVPALYLENKNVTKAEEKNEFNIVYIGAMTKRDLPDTMVNAVKHLIKAGYNVKFVIIGNVDSQRSGRRIKKQILNDTELHKRIVFTGWLSNEKIHDTLNNADAFILIRDNGKFSNGSFPTRLPELMNYRKPIILSGTTEFKNYFKHRHDACLVPPGDNPENISEEIQYLYNNPEKSQQIGEYCKEACDKYFVPEKYVDDLKKMVLY